MGLAAYLEEREEASMSTNQLFGEQGDVTRIAEAFNRSGFSRFINSPAGRAFRLIAGATFVVVGYVFRHGTLGLLSMVWGVLPLSAGAFDVCYISAVLGGPLSGARIRDRYHASNEPKTSGTSP
jgi:hypothetical protein